MSEFVRAALEANAVWSRPRYFAVESGVVNNPALGQELTFVFSSFDPGREYLITSYNMLGILNTDNALVTSTMFDPLTSMQFKLQKSGIEVYKGRPRTLDVMSRANNPTELENYIYMNGNEVLIATATVLIAGIVQVRYSLLFSCLEYLPKTAP